MNKMCIILSLSRLGIFPIIHDKINFVQYGVIIVWEFYVRFYSSQDIQDFIYWASTQPFTFIVGNDGYVVNGSSFMGMFTLDHSRPLKVRVSCSAEEYGQLLRNAERFLDK